MRHGTCQGRDGHGGCGRALIQRPPLGWLPLWCGGVDTVFDDGRDTRPSDEDVRRCDRAGAARSKAV
jgi:hypothetical protein